MRRAGRLLRQRRLGSGLGVGLGSGVGSGVGSGPGSGVGFGVGLGLHARRRGLGTAAAPNPSPNPKPSATPKPLDEEGKLVARAREVLEAYDAEGDDVDSAAWAETLSTAKASLREVVGTESPNAIEAAYLLGVLYLRQPTEPPPRPATPSAAAAGGGDGPNPAQAAVLAEILALRKTARRQRREKARRVLRGVPVQNQFIGPNGVEVQKQRAAPAIRVGVGEHFRAYRWFHAAAMGGHVNAMTRLGNLCVDNVGDDLSGGSANIGAAVDWYVRAAAAPAPSSDAMYNLAKLYRDGFQAQVSNTGEVQELVPQDSRRARFWLSRAGERGDADAALWLAHAARDGDAALGFDAPDRDACLAWLRKAMDMDAPGVWFYAAQLYRFGDPDIGMAPEEDKFWAYAERGAQGGDADALWALADAYMIGTPLRPRSPRKALALYERACDAGSGESALCLGALFFNGEAGVPQDYKAAFRYYELAAERGILIAWRNLAFMHAAGQGVPQDLAAAGRIFETWGPLIHDWLAEQTK
eukprot:CAMPEP_0118852252 /NCGR_PEP_ID=MMETSP1163-20130328/1308_1 /TAXON_ID=124430 /ORGANISM="Phaeomonas parva, Strain CCMP2877" /LENGTH=526 /DNA_ID=CAMNT_0006784661 /DNA_START=442 /DNA_END=2022 /DNA_ORIENTATION=+